MDEDRYVPLAQQQAITQQDLDNAKQTNQSMKAQVAAAQGPGGDREGADRGRAGGQSPPPRPAVETAEGESGFTRLTSPIDGIAGVATTQVGNLVGPSSNAVTTVSTLDPIKANFTVSEQEYLSLTRNDASCRQLATRSDACPTAPCIRRRADSPSPIARWIRAPARFS